MTVLPSRYEFVADLNKGSYGVVSVARDIKNDRLVAIKSIRSSTEAKQEIVIHDALGNLENDDPQHVSKLIDHFQVGKETFLVMEYYKQGDLYEAIRANRGPKDRGCIKEFMCQLIDAVQYCHSKSIYHRDIKPENVLLDDNNNVKLADFGLATTNRYCNDFGVGSERYMAPELFDEANAKDYDASKVDIWSIGICLLNIIFSRNPFTMASEKDKLFLDFASNREALFDIFPTLSSDAFSVLRHCLTLDPDNRSLSKMKAELLRVKSWTIDDYYDDLVEDEEVEDSQVPELVVNNDTITISDNSTTDDGADSVVTPKTPAKSSVRDFITTTTNRKPLRTPSIDVGGFDANSSRNTPWSRTMQFTPPNTKSILQQRFAKPLSGLRHFSMESVEEEDQDRRSNGIDDDEDQHSEGGLYDDSGDDDIFVMDLNSSTSKMSIRESSDSGSIDSVPSLVQSTTSSSAQMSSSLPTWSIPTTKTTPSRDFLKIGASWSDLTFEDDLDGENDDDQFLDFINSEFKNPMPGAKDIRAGWNRIMN